MTAQQVSSSLPADLVAEAEYWAGSNLPAYIAHGLRHQVLTDRRRHYLAELEAEFGPLTEEERGKGRRLWSGET
jgi:hypothetical protein